MYICIYSPTKEYDIVSWYVHVLIEFNVCKISQSINFHLANAMQSTAPMLHCQCTKFTKTTTIDHMSGHCHTIITRILSHKPIGRNTRTHTHTLCIPVLLLYIPSTFHSSLLHIIVVVTCCHRQSKVVHPYTRNVRTSCIIWMTVHV